MGRYLQPTSNWQDGLDIPFAFVRQETYLTVRIGAVTLTNKQGMCDLDKARLQVGLADRLVSCMQPLSFHQQSPFIERATFVLSQNEKTAELQILLHAHGADFDGVAAGGHTYSIHQPEDAGCYAPAGGAITTVTLDCNKQTVGSIEIQVCLLTSADMSSSKKNGRRRWK